MSEPQQPWRRLQDLEAPLGSKQRVLQRAQDAIDDMESEDTHAPYVLRWSLGLVACAAAIALVVFGFPGNENSQNTSVTGTADLLATVSEKRNPNAEPQMTSAQPTAQPTVVESTTIADPQKRVVAKHETLSMQLPAAEIVVVGPATVVTAANDRRAIRILEGRVKIAGVAIIQGPGCEFAVNGRAQATMVGGHLELSVEQGTAKGSHEKCKVTYQTMALTTWTKPAKPSRVNLKNQRERTRVAPVKELPPKVSATLPEPPVELAPIEPSPSPSPLRKQLDELKQAKILKGGARLSALRLFLQAWPDSALQEEAKTQMIESLMTLSRDAEAKRMMNRFIKTHPSSVHSNKYMQLLETL